MVYVNQIQTISYGVAKNRRFLKSLYLSDKLSNQPSNELFGEVNKHFDILDCTVSSQRKHDKDMTLDKFLKLIKKDTYITLQFGSPVPYEIRYRANIEDGIRKTLFIECPYNDDNYQIVSALFENSFGIRLEDIPVVAGLREYYEERIKNSSV